MVLDCFIACCFIPHAVQRQCRTFSEGAALKSMKIPARIGSRVILLVLFTFLLMSCPSGLHAPQEMPVQVTFDAQGGSAPVPATTMVTMSAAIPIQIPVIRNCSCAIAHFADLFRASAALLSSYVS